ncbi:hypothetical protein EDM59_12905 [Brevibacillus nitrificans]|uniref:DUF2269 family protein n=1 Tax=Brevibacillus nitrificans TaxID=651560 RepID=A0A3M8DBD7_9BACL|nr:hypothetical protein [Brevibacillus nitrificans]RNB85298.1 hypothetical protein EDM59_12905 [Brevibacillus nitrificans]
MKTISMTQKKWLLLLHVIFSAIMLGGAVIFLVLSIVAGTTGDSQVAQACYTVMHILSASSVRASTIGTLVTGILLSAFTHWGFLRYHWILAKEALSVVAILLGPIGMYVWTAGALHGGNGDMLLIGIILQIISLAAIFLLSVFKPWGKRIPK